MKLEFKPDDFFIVKPNYPDEDTFDWAARVANARLAEMLKNAPTSLMKEIKWFDGHIQYVTCNIYQNPTHIANLVNIEEIKNEPI